MEITKKDIRDLSSFKKWGATFTKVWSDDDRHLYVFKRTGVRTDYEVIKGVKTKNPDGSIAYAYPSSEQFGSNGYYIMGIPANYAENRIRNRLKQFDQSVDLSGLVI